MCPQAHRCCTGGVSLSVLSWALSNERRKPQQPSVISLAEMDGIDPSGFSWSRRFLKSPKVPCPFLDLLSSEGTNAGRCSHFPSLVRRFESSLSHWP